MWLVNACCCCYSYFRFCIKRILDKLSKVEFECGPEKSLGSENTKEDRKNKSSKEQRTPSMAPVDEVLQEKKTIAKDYLVTNNRNWGKMSAMMLAAETQNREIIAHDLCWKVINKVWRNGKIRQQAIYFALLQS